MIVVAEYSNNNQQVVNPGETVIFTESPVPCERGFVNHRDEQGSFILSGWIPRQYGCRCNRKDSALYLVDFGANIAIPTGGTAGAISLALTIGGSEIPASIMTVTPTATEQFFNVSRAINVQVFCNCCQTLTVRNISDQPILVQNANIIISRPDLAVTR